MKINRKELQEALTVVKPGLANKEILEQTTSFAFLEGRVVTYNDEISISHPIAGINFKGAVKAEELYGLLARLDKEEIDIQLGEGEIQIQCGRVTAGLRLEEKIQLPLKNLPKEWEELKNPQQFKNFMSLAMQTCAIDHSIPSLTCVYVKSEGLIMGSDGYRFVQCQGHGVPVDNFLIPAVSVYDLLEIDPTHIQLGESWIHFKNEQGTVFSCRRVVGQYRKQKDIDTLLDFSSDGEIHFPAKIEAMLDRGKQFAKKSHSTDEVVEISIENGKISMYAIAEETQSWITEKASIKTENEISIVFMITPKLFEDILKMTRSCLLDKTKGKVKFIIQQDGGDCEYIIMLADPQTRK